MWKTSNKQATTTTNSDKQISQLINYPIEVVLVIYTIMAEKIKIKPIASMWMCCKSCFAL